MSRLHSVRALPKFGAAAVHEAATSRVEPLVYSDAGARLLTAQCGKGLSGVGAAYLQTQPLPLPATTFP
jgi:hypothetical protein